MNLRVLHLIGSFNQGGSEHQALQLALVQRRSGKLQVNLACLDRNGPLLSEAQEFYRSEVPEFSLTSFYNFKTLSQLIRFAFLLRRQEIDILHTHDFYTNVFGMAGGALAGVPVRIASRRETFGFRSPMQKRVERIAYRLAHGVVANSETVRQQLVEEGVKASKISRIYNGLDLKRVTPNQGFSREATLARLKLPQGRDHRFVTLVANMRHPVKDHPTFLRAAKKVVEAVPQTCFVIAGEGELTPLVQKLASELGLGHQVFFIGRCKSIAELLAISDVCVLSSTAEGFSNAILEYSAAARPVVATDVGGAREAILDGQTGYLVAAGDFQRMAERIVSLLTDQNRARLMGDMGKAVVLEKFSCEVQLRRTLELYEELYQSRRKEKFLKESPNGLVGELENRQ